MSLRGERNNNPGNIDFNPDTHWQGLVGIEEGPEPRFCKFDCPENGIRAIAKILETYHSRGLDTVRKMLVRWAPSIENDSAAYVADVAKRMNVGPDDVLTFSPDALQHLVRAIIQHEEGEVIYSNAVIVDGVSRA